MRRTDIVHIPWTSIVAANEFKGGVALVVASSERRRAGTGARSLLV